MEQMSLEYFAEIARQRNISKAAETLHISQQSLSAYIQKLEKYYGVQLLIRKPKMKLTEAGERVLLAAEQINVIYSDMERDLLALQDKGEQKVSLGIFIPLVNRVMNRFPLLEISKKYPNISVRVTTDYNNPLQEKVLHGELDFAIVTSVKEPNGAFTEFDPALKSMLLTTDEECAIMTDQVMRLYFADEYEKYLEKFTEGMDLLDISHIPLVMHPMNSGLSKQIRKYFADHQCSFKVFGEGPTQEVVNSMVLNNNVMGFCSKNYSKDLVQISNKKIHVFPLKSPDFKRKIVIIYRKEHEKNDYMMGIAQIINDAWTKSYGNEVSGSDLERMMI